MNPIYLSFLLLLSGSAWGQALPSPTAQERSSLEKIVETQMSQMTLKEKVGQLFLFGFAGQEMSPPLAETLADLKPGGIILFARNIKSLAQVSLLISKAQTISLKKSRIPLLVAIDQEGGNVSRVATIPALPSPMSVGLTASSDIAYNMGHEIGQLMRSIGFNMNLAPVMDLVDYRHNSFIGSRSFGSDPLLVSKLTRAFSEGLTSVQVLPTAKHFPGTGDATTDPHTGIAIRSSTLKDLKETHIVPFLEYMAMPAPTAIMMSHAAYPKIDPTKSPASLSSFFMKKLLKEEFSYKGLVITDDVQMDGAKQNQEASKTAVHAILSGADMVMMTWSKVQQKRAIKDVVDAVSKGTLTTDRINESVKKILFVKAYYKMDMRPNVPTRVFADLIQTPQISKLDSEILDLNLEKSLGSSKRKMASVVQTFSDIVVLSSHRTFIQSAKTVKLDVKSRFFNIERALTAQGLKTFLDKNPRSLFVIPIYGGAIAKIVGQLKAKYRKQVMVVNFISPGVQEDEKNPEPTFYGVINLFNPHPYAGAKILEKIQSEGWVIKPKQQALNKN